MAIPVTRIISGGQSGELLAVAGFARLSRDERDDANQSGDKGKRQLSV